MQTDQLWKTESKSSSFLFARVKTSCPHFWVVPHSLLSDNITSPLWIDFIFFSSFFKKIVQLWRTQLGHPSHNNNNSSGSILHAWLGTHGWSPPPQITLVYEYIWRLFRCVHRQHKLGISDPKIKGSKHRWKWNERRSIRHRVMGPTTRSNHGLGWGGQQLACVLSCWSTFLRRFSWSGSPFYALHVLTRDRGARIRRLRPPSLGWIFGYKNWIISYYQIY